MTDCRTCEFCGDAVNETRKRCPHCRLLVCYGCWDYEYKCCTACVTLAERKMGALQALETE